ncbi:DUF7554 family protein [Halorubrum luteum]
MLRATLDVDDLLKIVLALVNVVLIVLWLTDRI